MTVDLINPWACDVRGYLLLNSFTGGKEHSRCVQLTMGGDEGYVQMTYDDARAFFQEGIDKINEIEEQFNKSPPWWELVQSSEKTEAST